MKYMTFNSSCSYCCLANLLEQHGVEREDRELALDMGLPWLFRYDEEAQAYLAGAMLQGKNWFDRALSPLGFCFCEEFLSRAEVPGRLKELGSAMVGLAVGQGKHAVVFLACQSERFRFLNPHRLGDGEPDELYLTEEELLERLGDENAVGSLERVESHPAALDILAESLAHLDEYCREMKEFCRRFRTGDEVISRVNSLFRPFAVDLLAMMELAGETGLAEKLRVFQRQCMTLFRAGDGCPADIIDLGLFSGITEEYRGLIQLHLKQ